MAILILLTALLFGCAAESAEKVARSEPTVKTEESAEADSRQEASIFNAGSQQFKIYSYYNAFDEYVALAKEEPDSLEDAYFKTVSQPFQYNAFSDGGGVEYMDTWIFDPPQDIIPLQSTIDAVAGKTADFELTIEEALKESAKLLPGGDKTVHIFPTASVQAQGLALNEEVMILWVYPTLTSEELKQTVAHEYFHLIDMEKGTFESSMAASTLLESTVMEGKAVSFASLVYPETDLSWISNEDGSVSEQVRTLFMQQKDSYDLQVWTDFLNGNSAKGIPPYATYMIGHEIMQSFLQNHPDVLINEWLKMTAEEILRGSDYRE